MLTEKTSVSPLSDLDIERPPKPLSDVDIERPLHVFKRLTEKRIFKWLTEQTFKCLSSQKRGQLMAHRKDL